MELLGGGLINTDGGWLFIGSYLWIACLFSIMICGLEEKARCVENRSIGVGWGVGRNVLDF